MTDSEILQDVGPLRTLGKLLDWCQSRSPAAEILEVIAQDELTFDIVVVVSPSVYLAFDAT